MSRRLSSDLRMLRQISALRDRLTEAEDTLDAIRSGAVDALVVHTSRGEQLFTLKGAEQSYRALVEAMNEGAITLKDGIISYCNNRFAEMAQIPMEKIFGASFYDLIESEDMSRMIRRLHKGRQAQSTAEASLRVADGRLMPVLLSSARFHYDGEVAIGLVVMDITDRKEAERARQELSRRIINALEQERQRVARDLHDSVNQILASAKYRLNNITALGRGASDNKDLHLVRDMIEKAISEVRLISRNLRPSELDDLGLVAALRSLTQEFDKSSGIATKFKSEMSGGPSRLPGEAEMTLYRIAQEAFNNVAKHSQATRAHVALSSTRFHTLLTIRDNGKGFRPEEVSRRESGWGLENMNERARLLGGSLEVRSLVNKGTSISARIPFANLAKTA